MVDCMLLIMEMFVARILCWLWDFLSYLWISFAVCRTSSNSQCLLSTEEFLCLFSLTVYHSNCFLLLCLGGCGIIEYWGSWCWVLIDLRVFLSLESLCAVVSELEIEFPFVLLFVGLLHNMGKVIRKIKEEEKCHYISLIRVVCGRFLLKKMGVRNRHHC